MKKIRHGFAKHPYIYSLLILIVIIVIGFVVLGKNGNGHETLIVERSTFKRQVSVSGKVIPTQSSELGFEQGGRIARINSPVNTVVKKGATLVSIENGDIQAEVLQRRAALEREQAKLLSLRQGTRPEQLAIDRQEYADATKTLLAASRLALLEIENALFSEIDTLFEHGNSVNPTLKDTASSQTVKNRIENERFLVTEKLASWKKTLSTLNEQSKIEEINSVRQEGVQAFNALDALLDDLNFNVNDLGTNNSGLTQEEIDANRQAVNSAGQDIASALEKVVSAESAWQTARNSLTLSEAGSTPSDIDAQVAMVKSAQADLLSAQARLTKTIITAPFDGVVTRMDLKVGEIVSPNTSKVTMMSNSSFEIESFVPEVHIAHIQPGNTAVVNLDAYGTEIPFLATVSSIDQAETIRDGVSTYKVKLTFNEADTRIRSGMTASVIVTTLEKPDTLVVPRSVIQEKDGVTTVRRLVNEEIIETTVETGDSTTLGQVEITNGLSEGDVVILDAPTE